MDFIFEDNILLHLSGPIEQISMHEKLSYVLNVGLITLDIGSDLYGMFPSVFS